MNFHAALGFPISSVVLVGSLCSQAAWIQSTPTTNPGSINFHGLAYMTSTNKTLLQVGSGTQSTWEWNGGVWKQLKPANQPGCLNAFAMAYDSRRNRVVLFGGNGAKGVTNETWEWNGTNWIKMNPKTSPPARREFSGAFDSRRGKFVIFGGYNAKTELNDTWEWDGTNWKQVLPATVPPRMAAHAMAYDSRRGRVVMFGGGLSYVSYSDTWEWDGVNWTKLTPKTRPRGRSWFAMTYDSVRGRSVIFGGQDRKTKTQLNDTWEWDGATWTPVLTKLSPQGEVAQAMAFDLARNRTVLVGSQTWELGYPSLTSSMSSVSLSAGGTVKFQLDIPPVHIGKLYLLLGSLGGTFPGLNLGNVTLPLNPFDPYFNYTVGNPNGLISGSFGVFVNASAQASLAIPKGSPTSLVGRKMHHAFVAFPKNPTSFDFVSNAVPLQLTK